MIAYHVWPSSTYYGKGAVGSVAYNCTSFFGGYKTPGLYRLVIRVHDGAYKIFKLLDEQKGETLYFDSKCKCTSGITIPKTMWQAKTPRKSLPKSQSKDDLWLLQLPKTTNGSNTD